MGITIFASGNIDRIEDIPRLINEMKAIAKNKDWAYEIMDDDFDAPPNVLLQHDSERPGVNIEGSLGLKGILLAIDPGVEPLAILFDRSGVLTGIMPQISWLQSNMLEKRFSPCKTQFGTIDSHICIIDIFGSSGFYQDDRYNQAPANINFALRMNKIRSLKNSISL